MPGFFRPKVTLVLRSEDVARLRSYREANWCLAEFCDQREIAGLRRLRWLVRAGIVHEGES